MEEKTMCLFCDIVEGKIPSTKVYENDKVLAFKDINPATPVHVLIVPKKHFDDILDMASSINNCREFGGQTVKHVHFHILGGVKLSEKMI